MISLDADEQTAVLRGISLTEGRNTVAFRIISGKADILEYEFLTSSAVKSTKLNSPKYRDGEWILTDGTLRLTDCYGKFLIGKENWGDYTVCAEVTPISDNINAGLLVRAKNPSLGEANNSVPAGINFVQGYFIGLREGSLCLGKLNYSWEEIVSLPADIRKDRSYHLEVTAEGSVITVVLDGVEVISYSDPDAFVQGCVGVRGIDSNVQVQNFTVAPIE